MEKILIARQGALGDVILVTPIVRQIKKMLGLNCEISVLTSFPFVFDNNPHVHIVYSNNQISETFTGLIDLNLAYENSPAEHVINAYANKINLNVEFDKQPELFLNSEQNLKVISELEQLKNPYIIIHMRNYGWPNRNFGENFWFKVVQDILARSTYDIVQIGAANEIAFNGNDRLIDKRGQYDIHVTKGIMDHAKAVICVDTGILHVAACTDTPIISIFTSASHEYRKPFRNDSTQFFPIIPKYNDGTVLECYGCQKKNPGLTNFYCERNDVICTTMISPDELVSQILKIS
jgi:ADP-heptose:LPS heptosyltransferase